MKLRNINDIQSLPSVLGLKELNQYLIQLIEILENDNTISQAQAAEEINNLISYQCFNEEGLSEETSLKILNWIKSNYEPQNKDSIECNSGSLANLNCYGVEEFINERIEKSNWEFEKNELVDCLKEIKESKNGGE
ncbi:hypothetical protein [Cyclobacterium qasimii]|uniref:Uncharacterized protein n=2 Tax=Cyclobacterium qasimii TaxID=1350429 RepID=S7VLH4_9BACT|nr:hypothetical protein [Cyclobacterium qasimii]EPR71060.1 hypothetical protein ADICYQ_0651 [Cyclobacterium qasimii M12-11B]GEO24018.1 hypothetical protein CQA01_45520 [Cyclobacterium qasimii]